MRRALLSLLVLLLTPALLSAQATLFSAPEGDLIWSLRGGGGGGIAGIADADLYLLDATGARTKLLLSESATPVIDTYLGYFLAGQQFGFEWYDRNLGAGTTTPRSSTGDLSDPAGLELTYLVGTLGVDYSSVTFDVAAGAPTTLTPEPMPMALLATGLVGLGAVGRRSRRQGVA